jgi:hypothetical protein
LIAVVAPIDPELPEDPIDVKNIDANLVDDHTDKSVM